jgi:hypothetical protein
LAIDRFVDCNRCPNLSGLVPDGVGGAQDRNLTSPGECGCAARSFPGIASAGRSRISAPCSRGRFPAGARPLERRTRVLRRTKATVGNACTNEPSCTLAYAPRFIRDRGLRLSVREDVNRQWRQPVGRADAVACERVAHWV